MDEDKHRRDLKSLSSFTVFALNISNQLFVAGTKKSSTFLQKYHTNERLFLQRARDANVGLRDSPLCRIIITHEEMKDLIVDCSWEFDSMPLRIREPVQISDQVIYEPILFDVGLVPIISEKIKELLVNFFRKIESPSIHDESVDVADQEVDIFFLCVARFGPDSPVHWFTWKDLQS